MKKFLIIIAFMLPFAFSSQAQVIVKEKPIAPKTVVLKTASPGPKYVWIEGHWRWDKKSKRYVWVEAHWAKAKRGHIWVEGHWIEVESGWKWIPGHWKSR